MHPECRELGENRVCLVLGRPPKMDNTQSEYYSLREGQTDNSTDPGDLRLNVPIFFCFVLFVYMTLGLHMRAAWGSPTVDGVLVDIAKE